MSDFTDQELFVSGGSYSPYQEISLGALTAEEELLLQQVFGDDAFDTTENENFVDPADTVNDNFEFNEFLHFDDAESVDNAGGNDFTDVNDDNTQEFVDINGVSQSSDNETVQDSTDFSADAQPDNDENTIALEHFDAVSQSNNHELVQESVDFNTIAQPDNNETSQTFVNIDSVSQPTNNNIATDLINFDSLSQPNNNQLALDFVNIDGFPPLNNTDTTLDSTDFTAHDSIDLNSSFAQYANSGTAGSDDSYDLTSFINSQDTIDLNSSFTQSDDNGATGIDNGQSGVQPMLHALPEPVSQQVQDPARLTMSWTDAMEFCQKVAEAAMNNLRATVNISAPPPDYDPQQFPLFPSDTPSVATSNGRASNRNQANRLSKQTKNFLSENFPVEEYQSSNRSSSASPSPASTPQIAPHRITKRGNNGSPSSQHQTSAWSANQAPQSITQVSGNGLSGTKPQRRTKKSKLPKLPVNTNPIDYTPAPHVNYRPDPARQIPAVPQVAQTDHPANNNIPIYGSYQRFFNSMEQAKAFREQVRIPPKEALDLERVMTHGQEYWVRRIYAAMIDTSTLEDSDKSIHVTRFTEAGKAVWHPQDLEAGAWNVLEQCFLVHTRGWNRAEALHQEIKRGEKKDVGPHIEERLEKICEVIRGHKACVDDVLRAATELELLADNPVARGSTKTSNNTGNKSRAEALGEGRVILEKKRRAAAEAAAAAGEASA